MKSVIDLAEQVKDYAAAGKTIAPVENGTTAVGSYAIGEKFIREGVLYKAKTSITAGDTLTLNTNYELADNVVTQISDVKQALTDLTNLVEGATEITTKSFAPVISVIDALPVNAVDVSAKIEPIQAGSGTPSPSNVRAISGRSEVTVTRAGKNLIEETIANSNIDGSGKIISNDSSYDIHIAKVKKGIIYRVKVSGNPIVYAFFTNKPSISSISYDGSRTVVDNVNSFTSPIDGYVAYRTPVGYSTPQVTIDTDASYEAPNVNDYTIQLGDTYYGGTLDVTTGVLTVDRVFKEYDGTETWTQHDTVANTYSTDYPSGVAYGANLNRDKGKSNAYTYDSNLTTDNTYALGGVNVSIKDSTHGTSLSDWTTYVTNNHIQFIFPLATPQVIQLTPQEIQMLQGNNTIFTDSGDTSIQYYANGVKNLEASVSAIQNDTNDLKALTAIFGTFENGTTASKPYVQGDYFVKNNKMCKAKTSIAKGATLTLNTNYEEKTLAEILKTIETA